MPAQIKACLFDVFGTCVDWRTSVESMLTSELQKKNRHDMLAQVPAMAASWREGYSRYNAKVVSGEIGTSEVEKIDVVHLRVLRKLISDYDLSGMWSELEINDMNLIWHRLRPWPDTCSGIDAVKKRCIVGTLSNGNVKLLVDMAKHSGLNWDVIISSELFKSAKDDPKVYLGGCALLDLRPQEVCMVACHPNDLQGAKRCGLQTAYIYRHGEAPGQNVDNADYIDHHIQEIDELVNFI